MSKTKSNPKSPPNSPTQKANIWDVLIKFLDVINDLFKTGNIFGAVLLLFFGYAIYITHKLPPENINAFIVMILKFLRAEKFYIFPGVAFLCVSLTANFWQNWYYTKEIKRLVELRKQLIHGFKSGEMEVLPEHSSSEFNIDGAD
jgi:hypothetical protein